MIEQKKKLRLDELQVESFVTLSSLPPQTIVGASAPVCVWDTPAIVVGDRPTDSCFAGGAPNATNLSYRDTDPVVCPTPLWTVAMGASCRQQFDCR